MPQQTATRSTGTIASANYQPRRLPQQRDGTRGPVRSHEEREEEVRLARKVLKAAGVQQPEVHARRLVDLREMGDDADYAPASVAWQGSAAGAREQLTLLRERLHEIRTLRAELAQRTSIQTPRVGDADTLWAREVRRDQPEQFRTLDRHAAEARKNLAEARRNGADKHTVAGLQTAVDVTAHQVRRAELASRRGERWEIFQQVQKLAPQMLADLRKREETLIAVHEESLSEALQSSHDPMLGAAPERDARPAPQPEAEPAYAGPQMRM
ncbi:hypothetical protein [Belnapia rosea]|uniref:hypothetical protein n=1 Tax=Belnapia rosea TaxID=938405 RepID=UPI00088D48F6|nr:hypothetical protein [Belnapia rosea]SDB71466.1 hypothetical protein SAMN02927895_04099 [Belnapia rosea]